MILRKVHTKKNEDSLCLPEKIMQKLSIYLKKTYNIREGIEDVELIETGIYGIVKLSGVS